MLRIYKIAALIVLGYVLPACTQIDDYMLGKDNTLSPSALIDITSKVKLSEDWSVQVGKSGKVSSNAKLVPMLQGDVIYTADATGMLAAVHKQSGKIIWTHALNDAIIAGPAVEKGYIAVNTHASNLVLLSAENGNELWKSKLSSESLSKPLITDDKVIDKSIDGNVYAFNLKDGAKLWMSEHGSPNLILKASSSPIRIENVALVGFSDGRLDAIDLQSGVVVWQRSIAYSSGVSDVERLVDIDSDPIVQDGIAYLATYQGYVGALSLKDGEFLWKKPISAYENMSLDASSLYLTDSDDLVWAFNRHTGQVNWKQISLKARGLSDPILFENKILVADQEGYLHILSRKSGDMIGRMKMASGIYISPVVSGRHIYVMTTNGKLSRLSVS